MSAAIALRTLLALTASMARVTCEIFFTLRMRSRISRAEAMFVYWTFSLMVAYSNGLVVN
jgi:hypothetical protein